MTLIRPVRAVQAEPIDADDDGYEDPDGFAIRDGPAAPNGETLQPGAPATLPRAEASKPARSRTPLPELFRAGGYQRLIRKAVHVRPIAFMVLLRIFDQSTGMGRAAWKGSAEQLLAGVRSKGGDQLADPLPIRRAALFKILGELEDAGLLMRRSHGHGLVLLVTLPDVPDD